MRLSTQIPHAAKACLNASDATSLSKRRKEKAAREGFEKREARRQAEKAAAEKEGS